MRICRIYGRQIYGALEGMRNFERPFFVTVYCVTRTVQKRLFFFGDAEVVTPSGVCRNTYLVAYPLEKRRLYG